MSEKQGLMESFGMASIGHILRLIDLALDIVIHKYAGRDATDAYLEVHSSSVARDNLDLECYRGTLDRSTLSAEWKQQHKPLEPRDKSNSASQAINTDQKPPLHTILNR